MQFVIRKSIGQNTVSTNAYIMSNIVETIDEEEIKNEYEIQDVLFVLMITQNLKKTKHLNLEMGVKLFQNTCNTLPAQS